MNSAVSSFNSLLERDQVGAYHFQSLIPKSKVETVCDFFEAQEALGCAGTRIYGEALSRVLSLMPEVTKVAKTILGESAQAVRSIFFNKHLDANWSVSWHQDRVMPVCNSENIPNGIIYSRKDGVLHVEIPEKLMSNILTLKVLLDDCPDSSGPQLFCPGSHRMGRMNQQSIDEYVSTEKYVSCVGLSGDVWALAYSLIHSSQRSQTSANRRILHIDFVNVPPPEPFEWYQMYA